MDLYPRMIVNAGQGGQRWIRLAIGLMMVAIAMPCVAAQGEKQQVHLYFIDARKPFLTAETRVIVNPGEPGDFGRLVVGALIHGPSRGKRATLPAGTQLRSFFVLEDGTAVADFSGALANHHPGSCRLEQLTLFSIVNSLILNVAEINRVKILIDGQEAHSLAGHLPLHYAFTADMLLIR